MTRPFGRARRWLTAAAVSFFMEALTQRGGVQRGEAQRRQMLRAVYTPSGVQVFLSFSHCQFSLFVRLFGRAVLPEEPCL